MIVVPAYGRDYKSRKEVKEAWESGKDFLIQDISSPDDGRYVNIEDVPDGTSLQIRYKKLTQVLILKSKRPIG